MHFKFGFLSLSLPASSLFQPLILLFLSIDLERVDVEHIECIAYSIELITEGIKNNSNNSFRTSNETKPRLKPKRAHNSEVKTFQFLCSSYRITMLYKIRTICMYTVVDVALYYSGPESFISLYIVSVWSCSCLLVCLNYSLLFEFPALAHTLFLSLGCTLFLHFCSCRKFSRKIRKSPPFGQLCLFTRIL